MYSYIRTTQDAEDFYKFVVNFDYKGLYADVVVFTKIFSYTMFAGDNTCKGGSYFNFYLL